MDEMNTREAEAQIQGGTAKPKRTRLTDRQKARKLFDKGKDVREVAAEMGVSYGTALWWSKPESE